MISLIQKKDGKKFEGDWKNDIIDGHGTLYFSNGLKQYVGEWKNFKRNGKGISYYKKKENIQYDGEWLNDKK